MAAVASSLADNHRDCAAVSPRESDRRYLHPTSMISCRNVETCGEPLVLSPIRGGDRAPVGVGHQHGRSRRNFPHYAAAPPDKFANLFAKGWRRRALFLRRCSPSARRPFLCMHGAWRWRHNARIPVDTTTTASTPPTTRVTMAARAPSTACAVWARTVSTVASAWSTSSATRCSTSATRRRAAAPCPCGSSASGTAPGRVPTRCRARPSAARRAAAPSHT